MPRIYIRHCMSLGLEDKRPDPAGVSRLDGQAVDHVEAGGALYVHGHQAGCRERRIKALRGSLDLFSELKTRGRELGLICC